MQLSPHFTLDELTFSQEAARKGIDNTPDSDEILRLKRLCVNVLDPLEDLIKTPVFVSSGFRCLRLNTAVGGSKNSQHMRGEAADTSAKGYTVEQLYQLIKNSNLPYDQLIQEFNRWVHVSYSERNRRQCLRATKDALNETVYTVDS